MARPGVQRPRVSSGTHEDRDGQRRLLLTLGAYPCLPATKEVRCDAGPVRLRPLHPAAGAGQQPQPAQWLPEKTDTESGSTPGHASCSKLV